MAPGVLRFPDSGKEPATFKPPIRPLPVFETVDPSHARELLELSSWLLRKAGKLIEYADLNRDQARRAGIESIAIQISAVIEGNRLESVIDALEEGLESAKPIKVTVEGLQRLRRFERLLSEAAANMERFGGSLSETDPSLDLEPSTRALGQVAPIRVHAGPSPTPGIFLVMPFVILGLAIIAYTAVQLGKSEA